MKLIIIGALAATLVISACSTQSSDSEVTSSAIPTPESSGSDMQYEPSETAQAVAAEVIGMTEAEAISKIEGVSSEELTYRVTRRDDESYPMTMDYRLNRINLEIDNGLVTKTSIG
jgi:ABC-type Fe3+-hydroxamate transport system substrate-binding protein